MRADPEAVTGRARWNFDTAAALIRHYVSGVHDLETGMNAKNGDVGTGADTEQVKEHLRAAKDAAASAARARAQQARDWASTQLDGLQQRVEEQPYMASAWALGAGFLAGILVMSLLRNSRRRT